MTITPAPGGGVRYSDDDDRTRKLYASPDAPIDPPLTAEDLRVLEELKTKAPLKPEA